MKAYEYRRFGLDNLALVERDEPRAAAHEVAVKFHAVSLNYRDLLFARGIYNPNAQFPAVPFCDGAGEVVEVGEHVTRWKLGDRVSPIYFQGWLEGEHSAQKDRTIIGAGYFDLDGVGSEYGVFDENGLVKIPEHLSFEEAATLPCAAVTAWHALIHFGSLKAGDTVLTLGTGGVSIFALQFAKMHGAQVIATSSSDEKVGRVRELGADETINYKRVPDWDKEVVRLTNGIGVDHVVEVGGVGTLSKSVNSARIGGRVALIGVLASGSGFDPINVLLKTIRMQGILVGSRQMFENMNRAIEANRLKPVIDRTFAFKEARKALDYLESGSHFGKIVLKF